MEKELSPARLTGFAGGLRRRYTVLAIAVAVLLIPAAAAHGAAKTTFAGTPPKGAVKGVPGFVTDNAFYPKRTEVHQGDKVAFKILGFHTITIPAKGEQPPALFALNPAAPVSGVKDAANADFWFNGNPSVGINPIAAGPAGGDVYDGTALVGSGLPGGPAKPYKVKFTKKGTYTVYCALHPGMKGKIVVKAKKAHITTKKQDAKRVKKQAKAAFALAKKLVAGQGVPSGLTVKAGNDKQGIAALAFFPAQKTVKVGQQVKFTVSDRTTETHNVAFAPQPYAQELAQSFLGAAGIDPRTVYPSQKPGTPLVVDGAAHGNGFVNTGMLDDVTSTPLPKSAVVTFSKAGTYEYYCIVHGAEMTGKITVTQ
jgi:plastocyanin